jgi:hypothetical protein
VKLGADLDLNYETRSALVIALDADGAMSAAGYLEGDVISEPDAFVALDDGRSP